MLGNGVPRLPQGLDDLVQACHFIIESDRQRMCIHVGFDLADTFQVLYGYTSRVGGAASDDAWCREQVADGLREGRSGDQQRQHSQVEAESFHRSDLLIFKRKETLVQ